MSTMQRHFCIESVPTVSQSYVTQRINLTLFYVCLICLSYLKERESTYHIQKMSTVDLISLSLGSFEFTLNHAGTKSQFE